MSGLDRRQLLSGGLLLAGSGAVLLSRPTKADAKVTQKALEDAVPTTVGPYRAAGADDIVLPPLDEVSERIYDRYLTRAYVAPNAPRILLLIAYGATQGYGLQLHRPEACYPASGWSLDRSQTVSLPLPDGRTIDGITMLARRPGRTEQILYWTRIGTWFTADEWNTRFQILRGAVNRNFPDGVIMRLSVSDARGDEAIQTLALFNRALIGATGPAGKSLLIGSPA